MRAQLLVSIVDSISACHAEDRGSIPRREARLFAAAERLVQKFLVQPEVAEGAPLRSQPEPEEMRWPGIDPGSTAWKAAMLTTIPPTQAADVGFGGQKRTLEAHEGCSSRNVGNVTSARGEGLRARLLVSIVDSISACHAADRGSIPRRGGPALCCRRTARPKFLVQPEVAEGVPLRSQPEPEEMRWPGIEPGSTAWKAAMLTTIPPTQAADVGFGGQKRRSKRTSHP
ncbi:hypothetical protein ROHU_004623 [Labeo rohita]|uniref:Uncharacterized protein n=1 Tax=Labeo rohita TaxID=84645 RepID=A0A498NKX0_LABRO|nr:hypothetical protein ROHU_004623 [Labeo rohita]